MSRFLCCAVLLLASPAGAEFLVQDGDYYERLTGLNTASQSIRITGGRVDVLEVGGTVGLTIDGGSIGELRSTGNANVLVRTGNFELESPIYLDDVFSLTLDGYNFYAPLVNDSRVISGWFVDYSYGEMTVASGDRFLDLGVIIRDHPPGDTQADGVVDLADLNNVRNWFANEGDHTNQLGDTDGDADVDLDDLNAVRNNFGADYRPSSNPVPEPSTLALAVAGCVAVAWQRRRRA